MSSAGFQSNSFQGGGAFQVGGLIVDPGPTVVTFLPYSSNRQVTELSDYFATLEFQDVFGVDYVPSSVNWRVWDDTNKVQLQDWTPLTPNQVINLDIPAALNALGNPNNLQEWRIILLHIVAPGGAVRYDRATYSVVALQDTP